MKLYTNESQTAKLIELGFKEPKSKVGGRIIYEPDADLEIEWKEAYSIGELIDFLPEEMTIDDFTYSKIISKNEILYYCWIFETGLYISDNNDELIDNLFDMCVKLKEEKIL